MLQVLLNWIRQATRDAILNGVEDAFAELDDGIGPSDGAPRLRERILALTAKEPEAVATTEKGGKRK